MSSIDDEFKARALAAEAAEKDRIANRGSGNFTKNYENIKWTGLKPSVMKIVRALGEEPNFCLDDPKLPYMATTRATPFDARVIRLARVLDDKGKRMRLILPFESVDENYIMWRLIHKVNEFEWVDRKRVYVNATKFPNIYNIINFNGLEESDNSRKYGLEGRGWMGREMFIMNIIDRALQEWHSENKHSVLLSKNINVGKNVEGKEIEYIDEGVPAYGFTSKIQIGLTKYYGSWESFDIGLERTGTQAEPIRCINASKNIEQVPANMQSLVSSGPLTDEEKSWVRYDISKLFGVTSYSKIYNKLHLTIAMVDKALGSKYLEELHSLAEDEKAQFAIRGEAEPEDSSTADTLNEPTKVQVSVTKPVYEDDEPVRGSNLPTSPIVSTASTSSTASSASSVASLPAYASLTATEKNLIDSVSNLAEGGYNITYKEGGGKLFKCPDCKTKSPESFKTCPVCGLNLGGF